MELQGKCENPWFHDYRAGGREWPASTSEGPEDDYQPWEKQGSDHTLQIQGNKKIKYKSSGRWGLVSWRVILYTKRLQVCFPIRAQPGCGFSPWSGWVLEENDQCFSLPQLRIIQIKRSTRKYFPMLSDFHLSGVILATRIIPCGCFHVGHVWLSHVAVCVAKSPKLQPWSNSLPPCGSAPYL